MQARMPSHLNKFSDIHIDSVHHFLTIDIITTEFHEDDITISGSKNNKRAKKKYKCKRDFLPNGGMKFPNILQW